jgi:hypothetical protein
LAITSVRKRRHTAIATDANTSASGVFCTRDVVDRGLRKAARDGIRLPERGRGVGGARAPAAPAADRSLRHGAWRARVRPRRLRCRRAGNTRARAESHRRHRAPAATAAQARGAPAATRRPA